MSDPRGRPGPEPTFFQTLTSDVGRVTADVMKRGVRREFDSTLSGLETFYLSEEERHRLADMRPLRRMLVRLVWLVKSLLMRLTAARRVLLALALVLVLLGMEHVQVGTVRVSFPVSRVLGDLLLFLVLMLELKDKLLARDELEAGRKVQLALMPERSPSVNGWDLWLYTEPANDVGGDLIDHLPIDDRHHGVTLGDVAGKALPAALLMVKLQATLRALVPQFDTFTDLGAALNRILVRDGLPNRFATLVYLVLTCDSGEVRVLNAGHMPPLVIRRCTTEEMPRGSTALGLMPQATYVEQRLELSPGDVILVYSDGITEAMNLSGDFFGDERLRACIQETTGQPVAAIGARILECLATFVGEAPPHDDVSLVVVRRQ